MTDLGYSDIGAFGGEIRTPNLDKLAADGARFTNCESNSQHAHQMQLGPPTVETGLSCLATDLGVAQTTPLHHAARPERCCSQAQITISPASV